MKVSLVFDPDPDLGPDPLDPAQEARRQGVFIDSEHEDVLVIHRKWGTQYEGHQRTEVYASGVWENLDAGAVVEALDTL